MLVETEDLVTAIDVAVRLEVNISTVNHWHRSEPSFPVPVVTVGKKTRLWLWPEIVNWAQGWGFTVDRVDIDLREGKPPRLMTAIDIAELRNWKTTATVHSMIRSGYFVKPLRKIGKAWVWDYEEVMYWHEHHPMKRRKGVPPP